MIRRGDERALVMLFRDTRRPVLSYILAHHGSPDDAEDVLQDALIILWERVRTGRFEHRARLSTFVLGVVRNLWLRVLAERRREPLLAPEEDPPAPDEGAAESMVRNEQTELVQKAMARLDETCRQLLLLYYWEEKSMEEIARIMEFANAATAKSKKYQCKKALERYVRSFLDVSER